MTVGLVLVSHSEKLAEGLAEVAVQMAPEVAVVPAGGMPEGGIGTDYDRVLEAVERANSGDGVVLLYDLGSARMTADMVAESLGDPESAVVAEAPLVEGAVAAAVAAQGGANLAAVRSAAASAGGGPAAEEAPDLAAANDVSGVELTLRNDVGLHARPAAVLARSLSGVDAQVSVQLGEQEADAHSVLALMSLGARQGDTIEVKARGTQAAEALQRVKALVENNFDE
jgi:PTS hybrid protein